ncbi:MAG: hypothetical protein P8X67_13985 [Syntrophobacterales bacterium]|jgi:hypothetical protein
MKKLLYWSLQTFIVCGVLLACVGSLQFTVFYDRDEGLKQEDPVLWNQQEIGKVHSVKQNPQGRLAVGLKIDRDFREKVTEKSRFLIQADPQNYWQKHIEMVNLAEGGNPLPNGAEIEGSTYLTLQVERGSRGLAAWSTLLMQELERWQKELNELPVEEWYKELERQLDYWLSEIGQAGVETRRYFKEEVLPRLEEAVRELERRLKELGKKNEAEILNIKLKELKQL